ncbi:NACHT domain-containing protein [Streptomyces sp. M19]
MARRQHRPAAAAARHGAADRPGPVRPPAAHRQPPGRTAHPDRLLAAAHNPLHGAQPAGWADRVLAAGRGLLLVDGLDEIPERDRDRVRDWLTDLLIAYPGNLWLVTSRPPPSPTTGWPTRTSPSSPCRR